MKTKVLFLGLMGLLLLTTTNCDMNNDESNSIEWDDSYLTKDVLYPPNSKLKRVIEGTGENAHVIQKYEYNQSGQISKVTSSIEEYYDQYEYNAKGQLSSILNYYNKQLGNTLLFTYDSDGNKIKEETKNTTIGNPYVYTYTYKSGVLVESEHYFYYINGGVNHHFINYEYNAFKELIIEKLSVPGEEGYVTTEHAYRNGLLYYSISYDGNKETGFLSDSKKIRDLNGNLVMTIDNCPGLSSTIIDPKTGKQSDFYITRRYEY